jgi:hypothetical protein
MGQRPSWGEVRQEWGGSLISSVPEVKGWLATLWRLVLWVFQVLFPLSVPKLEEEAILAS